MKPAPSVPTDQAPAALLPGVRERVVGLAGLLVVAVALGWALAGGGAVIVGALVVIGLALTVADAVTWRGADLDLAVPEGERLPAVPWGFVVGPAGALGLVAALVAGALVIAVLAAAAAVASLPGAVARLPRTPLPYRAAAQARRLRQFVQAHGAAEGQPVAGYVAPVGESGSRLFVFAPDGAWGDVMLRPDESESVVALARIDLAEATDPDAGRKLQIGPQLWETMNRSW